MSGRERKPVTIWDRLADHSISRRYYYSDVPLLALWGSKYFSIRGK
jgi:phospholipase C